MLFNLQNTYALTNAMNQCRNLLSLSRIYENHSFTRCMNRVGIRIDAMNCIFFSSDTKCQKTTNEFFHCLLINENV